MSVTRRRRLYIGLAVAALLFGTASWLPRRQVDLRYVGKWTIHLPSGDRTWPVPMVEFRQDGTATWWSSHVPQNRMYSPSRLRWRISGNRLIWRHEYESLGVAMHREFDQLRGRFWDRNAVGPHENVFQIVTAANNEIEVDDIGPGTTRRRFILRRTE